MKTAGRWGAFPTRRTRVSAAFDPSMPQGGLVAERGEQDRYLPIYLNDHLAGATVGVELARRLRSSNRSHAAFGTSLERVCGEIEGDRRTLEQLMERLDVSRCQTKVGAAWVVEKLGRLKLNGHLLGYSPLSRLVELEGLSIGIAGKIELWRVLQLTLGAEWEGFDFRQLLERAVRQRETVEELHLGAADVAFSAKPLTGTGD